MQAASQTTEGIRSLPDHGRHSTGQTAASSQRPAALMTQLQVD
ncbi:hypothetical protein [Vogesella sp. LIG4]|nr:hypothetical protein [Vogesella sp. LIG4]